MNTHTDDLGHPVNCPASATRVVSLVPSITESLASVRRAAIVGATNWCTHPGDLDVVRVRGTKNPDLELIRKLQPDLVIANKEENRRVDVERLRAAGVPVWVTDIESVPQAIDSLGRLFAQALGWPRPAWLDQVAQTWADFAPARGRVVVPIWRDPWMVVGGGTFTTDLLRRLGWENAFAGLPRYPQVELSAIDEAGADVVLLPDEPYVFTAEDGPEAFTATPTKLVSGRLLTWYGPSLLESWSTLSGSTALDPDQPGQVD